MTDVTDIDIQGGTNFFIRSDGSVYASGINDFSGYAASLVHGAVFARPFTVLGQQVYLDETASPTPYTTERVQTITVSKPDMAATVGETFTLTASVFPQDTYERNIYWKSSDLSVATVDGAGNVTTHGVGTAVPAPTNTMDVFRYISTVLRLFRLRADIICPPFRVDLIPGVP